MLRRSGDENEGDAGERPGFDDIIGSYLDRTG